VKGFVCVLLAAFLSACGGDSSSDDNGPSKQPRKNYANEAQPENSVLPTPENMVPFVGVYDASDGAFNEGDEIYYIINEKGIIRTYDYMNDAVDSRGNCYKQASKTPLKANYDMEGRQFYWDEAGQRLVMTYRGALFSINLNADSVPVDFRFLNTTRTKISQLSPGGTTGFPEPMLAHMLLLPTTSGPTMSDLINGDC